MKVVIDTNILVSALLNAGSIPAQILNLVLNQKLQIQYNNPILQEYRNVLSRGKFAFDQASVVEPLIDFIRYEGELVVSEPNAEIFTDPDNKKFYEVFISGNSKHLITGNLKHFPTDPRILSPKDFIDFYTSHTKHQS